MVMLHPLAHWILSFLLITLGFVSGMYYPLLQLQVAPPFLEERSVTLVPFITLDRVTQDTLELRSTSGDVRFLLAGEVFVPDKDRSVRIHIPGVMAAVTTEEGAEEGPCLFVARSNGRVYYKMDSSQGRAIPEEQRRCFPSHSAAQAGGFGPSASLQ